MNDTIMYLKSIFKNRIYFLYNEYEKNIPLYMNEQFTFLKFKIDGNSKKYILAKPNKRIDIKINTIRKQVQQIENYTNCFPIIVFDELRLTQRNALINAGFSFIVPNYQIFIPDVMLSLIEKDVVKKEYTSKFSVNTQVVYIHLLLNNIIETNARRLMDSLPFSAATLTRSLNELVERDLLNTIGSNTRKIYVRIEKKKYWDQGKQFLFNPVSKTHFLNSGTDLDHLLMSNETALSILSETLNESKIIYYSATTDDIKKFRNKLAHQYDFFDDDYYIVEQFKYDPSILSYSDCIDVISLYAQFKDNKDERIQIALDEIIGEEIC